jgi:hypothetical protein
LLPDLSALNLKIEHEWYGIDVLNYDEETIRKLLENFKDELRGAEARYIGNAWFPKFYGLAAKAERERDLFATTKHIRS